MITDYHGEFPVSSANIRGGSVSANPENGVVARSAAVGSSFPIHEFTEEAPENSNGEGFQRRQGEPKAIKECKNVERKGIKEDINEWGRRKR